MTVIPVPASYAGLMPVFTEGLRRGGRVENGENGENRGINPGINLLFLSVSSWFMSEFLIRRSPPVSFLGTSPGDILISGLCAESGHEAG